MEISQSRPETLLGKIDALIEFASAKLNGIGRVTQEPLYNFTGHEAERFAFVLADVAGQFEKLDAVGHTSDEGRKLVLEMAKSRLESAGGLGYPEDPIGAVLKLSGLTQKLLKNNLRLPDETEVDWGKVAQSFTARFSVKELARELLNETKRSSHAIFAAREGDPESGILPLATKQTIDRLAASAGEKIVKELASGCAPARMLELQLEVLKKAGLVERERE